MIFLINHVIPAMAVDERLFSSSLILQDLSKKVVDHVPDIYQKRALQRVK